jgi:hypothetical protein
MTIEDTTRWSAKHDAFRTTTEFMDLLRIVTCYYEMYSRATTFVGPWIAKQQPTMFLIPERDQIKSALGRERPEFSFRARSAFIESIIQFLAATKGKKTLIHPTPSSHHSAQFPCGTFEIKMVQGAKPLLRDEKAERRSVKTLHQITVAGSDDPIFVENLSIPPEQVKFIILRPKMGRLGMPSTSKWEVLLYKKQHGYLVEHTDSELNPRHAGKL